MFIHQGTLCEYFEKMIVIIYFNCEPMKQFRIACFLNHEALQPTISSRTQGNRIQTQFLLMLLLLMLL